MLSNELNNDASMTPDRARALHRVVRAMHDGNCPKCGFLAPSDAFYWPENSAGDEAFHQCPRCRFTMFESESTAALEAFRPYMEANVTEFENWRKERIEVPHAE